MAISRFNLHALVDQDEVDDDGVVELVRVEPPLAHLLPDPSVLFAKFPGYEPSFPKSVYPIQDIPFIRCSTSRSCDGCNRSACTKNEPPCDACKSPRNKAFCLHLSPCLKWPTEVQERYRDHQRFLQENQERGRQREAAGGAPPATASLQSLLPARPAPPPHHHMATPDTPISDAHPRGYCQPQEVSPINPHAGTSSSTLVASTPDPTGGSRIEMPLRHDQPRRGDRHRPSDVAQQETRRQQVGDHHSQHSQTSQEIAAQLQRQADQLQNLRLEEERRKHFSAMEQPRRPTQQPGDRPSTQQRGGELEGLMRNVVGDLVRAKEERTRAEPPSSQVDHPAPSQHGDDGRTEEEEDFRRRARAFLDEGLSHDAVSSDRWSLSMPSSHGVAPDPTRRNQSPILHTDSRFPRDERRRAERPPPRPRPTPPPRSRQRDSHQGSLASALGLGSGPPPSDHTGSGPPPSYHSGSGPPPSYHTDPSYHHSRPTQEQSRPMNRDVESIGAPGVRDDPLDPTAAVAAPPGDPNASGVGSYRSHRPPLNHGLLRSQDARSQDTTYASLSFGHHAPPPGPPPSTSSFLSSFAPPPPRAPPIRPVVPQPMGNPGTQTSSSHLSSAPTPRFPSSGGPSHSNPPPSYDPPPPYHHGMGGPPRPPPARSPPNTHHHYRASSPPLRGHHYPPGSPPSRSGHHHHRAASPPQSGHHHRRAASPPSGHHHHRAASPPSGHHHHRAASPPSGHHHHRAASPPRSGHHHHRAASPPPSGHHHHRAASPPPSGHHRHRTAADGGISIPLGLIIDRLYDLEGLIARRAAAPAAAPAAASASSNGSLAKIKPVSFPYPKYESNGDLSPVQFYLWFFNFVRTVESLKLPHEVCLHELANNHRMLPAEHRQIAYEADSLTTALSNIRDRFTPLEGLWPQMSDQILLTPKCTNNKERLDASGQLLTTLSLLRSWFPSQDIRKEEFVFAIHQLETTDGDGNIQLMHDMARYDELRNLPKSDPNYRSYVQSLHSRLEELRKLWTQMAASLDVAARVQGSNKARSWAASARLPASSSASRPPQAQPPSPLTGPPPQGPAPVKKAQCLLCRNSNLDLHKIYQCPLLPDYREKKIKLPAGICPRCATKIGDQPHAQDCHLKSDRKTGEKYSLACPIHQDPPRHKKLCQDCGGTLPEPKKKKPKVSHRAARVVPPAPLQPNLSPFQQVQFLSEVVMLVGKNGERAPTRLSYDCGGGLHFLKTTVPENFQWEPEKMSEAFQLSTVTGMEEVQFPEVKIRILGQQGSEHPVSAMVSDFVDNGVFFLDKETAKKCNVTGPTKEEYDQTQYSLILGISAASLFPQQIETPKILQKRYPGVTLLRSVLTNRILFQGPMPSTAASSFSARAFSSWTPPDGAAGPEEGGEELGARLYEVDSTPATSSSTTATETGDPSAS